MDVASQILKWLGGLVVVAGGASVIGALAIQAFKHFSDKWLDARFASKLQVLKHAHDQELESLRFKIATLLDRATKLHSREFEVLPEAWSKLNDAFWQGMQFVSPFQSYPDLEREDPKARDKFLENCRLQEWEKEDVRQAKQMNKKYQELIFKHDLAAAKGKYRDAGVLVSKSGIFIQEDIRGRFQKLLDLIWNAIAETEVYHDIEDGFRQSEGAQALRSTGESLLRELEKVIYERLWATQSA